MIRITPELLEKYQHGNCCEKEIKAIEQWLDDADAEGKLPDETKLEIIGANIWANIAPPVPAEVKPTRKRFQRTSFAYAAAACTLMLTASLAAIWLYNTRQIGQKQSYTVSNEANSLFKVPAGRKGKISLSDGSVIFLNSGSEISYPEVFSEHSRTVSLNGEAYFEIAKDPTKPFIVLTKNTQTRVLGTKFNLKAYDAKNKSILSVTEGKVQFSESKHGSRLILTANQQAVFNQDTLLQRNVYAKTYTQWKDNQLIIDDQRMDELAHTLELWYGIQVDIRSKALKNLKITASYDNPSLTELLKSMSYTLKFNYQLSGTRLVLY